MIYPIMDANPNLLGCTLDLVNADTDALVSVFRSKMSPKVGTRVTNPACALQGIAARWLSAHYKTIARSIARAMARGLGFVTPCPNKQGKNAYFSKVSDASGTACDADNVKKDRKMSLNYALDILM